jgi:hypothetical protein
MAYSSRYVSVTDIPVQIPDDYTNSQKEDALEYAEATLELDLNEGDEIPSEVVSVLMRAAVKQLATCQLAKGAEDPNDITLGDLEDGGDTKVEYAQSFCDEYDKIVDKIIDSGILEESDLDGEGESNSPFVYTTEDPSEGNIYTV